MKHSLSEEQITVILNALVANGLNYALTAKQHRVARPSLIRWAREAGIVSGAKVPLELKYQIKVKNKKTAENAVIISERRSWDMEERKRQLELDVMEINEAAVRQILTVIPRTQDPEKIAKSIKILDDLLHGKIAVPPGDEGSTSTNFIQIINEQLKYMDHEPTED